MTIKASWPTGLLLAAGLASAAAAAETASPQAAPIPGTTAETPVSPGSTGAAKSDAAADAADKNNVNSAVGGTGELPNSGSVSGGEDPGGQPTNCLTGDTRPICTAKP